MDWIDDLSEAWERESPELDAAALPPLVRLARLGLLIQTFQLEVGGEEDTGGLDSQIGLGGDQTAVVLLLEDFAISPGSWRIS